MRLLQPEQRLCSLRYHNRRNSWRFRPAASSGTKAEKKTASKGFGKHRAEQIKSSTAGNLESSTGPRSQQSRQGKGHNANRAKSSAAGQAVGPLGLLLTNFSEADATAVRDWLAPIDPDFKVSCCSDAMLDSTLEDALTKSDGSFRHDPGWYPQGAGVPRVAVFSGITRQQALDMADLWHLSGVREPVFMSMVEPAKNRQLLSVLKEVDEHSRSKDAGPEEKLDADGLRKQLRRRMAAKLGTLDRQHNGNDANPVNGAI